MIRTIIVDAGDTHDSIKPPNELEGVIATFGNISAYTRDDGHLKQSWETEHLVAARIPFAIPLSWDRSQSVRGIFCHILLAPLVSELFPRIHQ